MTDATPSPTPATDLPPQPKPRGSGRQFSPGQSGNPAGPKRGQRHPAFAALDAIGQDGAEDIIRAVRDKAIDGDMRAAEIVLRRVWPERKGRPLRFSMPPVTDASDLPAAMAAVSLAITNGDLTPDEAASVAAVIELHRKTIETHDLSARLAALEATMKGNAR